MSNFFDLLKQQTKQEGLPDFVKTKFQSLTEQQKQLLLAGYFIVRKRDPQLKIYVGDKSGDIYEILIDSTLQWKLEGALRRLNLINASV